MTLKHDKEILLTTNHGIVGQYFCRYLIINIGVNSFPVNGICLDYYQFHIFAINHT